MEKVIVYGLGKCWEHYADRLIKDYDILYCSDMNKEKMGAGRGIPFVHPSEVKKLEYDKLILCCYMFGMREELILEYGLKCENMVYCLEIYEEIASSPDQVLAENRDKLTIVITTYNRRQRLSRTLDLLELQTNPNYNIIILDDNSDYEIFDLIEHRSEELKQKISIKKNISNLGLSGNTAFAFIQVSDGWIWTLADDDIPSIYAVEIIHQEIEKSNDAGIILFSTNSMKKYMQDTYSEFDSVSGMLNFYQNIMSRDNIESIEGDFIFFSNKVYNVNKIRRCMKTVFTYLYTTIPQNILILSMLNKGEGRFRISDRKIVGYSAPDGDHWDWLDNGLGMTILADVPLNISDEDRKILYRLCMFDYRRVLQAARHEGTLDAVNKLKKMYFRLYQYYLSETDKQIYRNTLEEMETV